jgi:hypothetical protein
VARLADRDPKLRPRCLVRGDPERSPDLADHRLGQFLETWRRARSCGIPAIEDRRTPDLGRISRRQLPSGEHSERPRRRCPPRP